jgi:hypothetical protein
MPKRKQYSAKRAALKHGYRSGLENTIATQIAEQGIAVDYENKQHVIPYTQPALQRKYTPDFVLPNGVIIETKGRLVDADRKKHVLIKEQYPDKDIRFVFQSANNKIRKGSKTTYADWADKHGFKWSEKNIPNSWFQEPRK